MQTSAWLGLAVILGAAGGIVAAAAGAPARVQLALLLAVVFVALAAGLGYVLSRLHAEGETRDG